MKRDNYNKFDNNVECKKNVNSVKKSDRDYSYYSRVLKEPFDSIEELKAAEEAYYARLSAKEDKAAQKKADAKKVEDAFVHLNSMRKAYKDELTLITTEYAQSLSQLREDFDKRRQTLASKLARAEEAYSAELKAFTSKYPEGFHLTLKDGDFETTISGGNEVDSKAINLTDIFNWLASWSVG